MAAKNGSQPWFVSGDIDGFFGLAIDNLIQFLLILGLCAGVLGFSTSVILGKILPGAALSILVGNIFYAWQAQKLSAETGRTDVTSLPYGINTVSLFAFVFLIMLPMKAVALKNGVSKEQASLMAWQIGLVACFLSGVIEFLGAFVADKIRKVTPRAALLSTLAGIAISFIALDFAAQTFENPLIALLPLGVILTTYFSHMKLPFRIPGGVWAVLLGSLVAWCLYAMGETSPVSAKKVAASIKTVGLYVPVPVIQDLIAGFQNPLTYQYLVPVILPMGLFNVLGSLQNIESAEVAGDSYKTMPSLAVNGIGSVVAACFGSCFPTTIYIGHPGWKGLGARTGYSVLNGVFFAVVACLGLTGLLNAIFPMQSGMAILLWIAVIITAQSFQANKKEHAPAVAIGLFPSIAAWGVVVISQALNAAQIAMKSPGLTDKVLSSKFSFSLVGLHLDGLVALSQGFMLTCMVWASASVYLIEKKFKVAAVWAVLGACASFFGFIHAGKITSAGAHYNIGFATGWKWALGYALCALFFLGMEAWKSHAESESTPLK